MIKRMDQTFILSVVSDGADVTIAAIEAAGTHLPGAATCSAKLHPTDTYDYDTGVRLATSRVLRALADEIDPGV